MSMKLQFDTLDEFIRFCDENGLKDNYVMLGIGTVFTPDGKFVRVDAVATMRNDKDSVLFYTQGMGAEPPYTTMLEETKKRTKLLLDEWEKKFKEKKYDIYYGVWLE